jgi:acyl-CoA reductase-like NAD-dependent aldehyde dehydrogenase
MARPEMRDRVSARVRDAVASGAVVRAGGELSSVANRPGWFFPPTVLDGVDNSAPVAREELFGPVLSVLRFSDEAEALEIANDSEFGIAAGVWTNDLNRAHRMAADLEVGTVWINTYRALNFASPFGGRKNSGYGRELGHEGLLEFTQTKSVWIDTSGLPVADPFVLR